MSIKQVYDTTALISLASIKKLDLLNRLDLVTFVPQAVVEELEDISKYRDEIADSAKDVIKLINGIEKRELEEEFKKLADKVSRLPRIDKGEAEILALAYQINAKEIVIDDVDAIGGLAGISKVIGIEIIPSSYILVKAYLKDIMSYEETKSLLERLAIKRGWEQSVLYETAVIMLEEAKKIKL